MKLVISVVHRDDAEAVASALVTEGFRATTLSTTGGFLREGNATILIGVEEDGVPRVLDLIKDNTHEHTQHVPALLRLLVPHSDDVHIGAATVFVLDLAEIARF